MNANELADELERVYSETKEDERTITEATTMLRQQQAEIEALKKEKGHIRACPNSDGANSFARVSQSIIAKTLTDEEIVNIGYHYGELGLNLEMIRAILKKASEK
jgi:hypothetical protein